MEACPSCGVENQSDSIRCQCGFEIGRSETSISHQSSTSKVESKSDKYPMLKLLASGYKILAWLVIPIFLLASLGTLKSIGTEGVVVVFVYLLYAAGAFITLYAISEGIHVFMDIEKNTRRS